MEGHQSVLLWAEVAATVWETNSSVTDSSMDPPLGCWVWKVPVLAALGPGEDPNLTRINSISKTRDPVTVRPSPEWWWLTWTPPPVLVNTKSQPKNYTCWHTTGLWAWILGTKGTPSVVLCFDSLVDPSLPDPTSCFNSSSIALKKYECEFTEP